MFGRDTRSPVAAADREWIEGSFAWLADRFGASLLASRVLLPTAEDFPGPFSGEVEQAQALVVGIASAMGLDLDTERLTAAPFAHGALGSVAARGLTGCASYPGGAFSSGAKGRVIALDTALAGRPIELVATIAHMLGHLRFVGEDGVPAHRMTRERLIDLLAVYSGLGVFGANAAVEVEVDPLANVRAAASRGLSQGRSKFRHRTYLSEEMHGYALACFAFMRGEARPKWSKHLDTNPRAYMRQSLGYLSQHPAEPLVALRAGSNKG